MRFFSKDEEEMKLFLFFAGSPSHFLVPFSCSRSPAHAQIKIISKEKIKGARKHQKLLRQLTLASPSMFIVPKKLVLIVLIGLYL